jgi:hypothetical protein
MIELDYNEEVARFTYRGTTERVVIGQNRRTKAWVMRYLRGDDGEVEQAVIDHGTSREEILRQTKGFMIGHGRVLVENVIQSMEKRCR